MKKYRKLPAAILGFGFFLILGLQQCMTVQAGGDDYLEQLRGGVASVLTPVSSNPVDTVNATAKELNLDLWTETEEEPESRLVMANVKSALNVRSEANESSEKVGMLYKDCGGTILERKDGWTRLQSGNIIGWASDEYLLFGDEARDLANDVGKMVATISTETLRVRSAPSADSDTCGLLPQGEIVEVLDEREDGWICVDYEGTDGYVSSDYVALNFLIDEGETVEEIQAREEKAEESRRHVNYGEYTADADTRMLLAALIQCEAGGESYEGQVAVGAVVMNRVRSGAYPDSIHGVIYASGQFTPAMTGKLNRVYEAGNIYPSCIKAAEEALAGVSNVGDRTHFRRNNGREGLVIGNHVFY